MSSPLVEQVIGDIKDWAAIWDNAKFFMLYWLDPQQPVDNFPEWMFLDLFLCIALLWVCLDQMCSIIDRNGPIFAVFCCWR